MKFNIYKNAFFSFVQVVVVSITIFFTYKFLLLKLGPEKLGVWSLIVASVSILNIGNLGLSATMVKYIAKYLVHNDFENISKTVQTALITVLAVASFLILTGLIFAKFFLKLILPDDFVSIANSILPFSLINVTLLLFAGIILSTLDGAQKFYIRNLIQITGTLFFFATIFILIPAYDLIGVVYAQLIQSIFVNLAGWVVIRKQFPQIPPIPYHWNKTTFNTIIKYGFNLQLISILQLFYEPITKSLLSLYGGLASVGYYEMANRMVLKFRELIVSIFQVLVPVYATNLELEDANIIDLYKKSVNYLFFLVVPLFSLLILSLPLISILWLGKYEESFILFAIILFAAWFINMLTVPAYFAYLGLGELKWNVLSHLVIGILNVILCYILGNFMRGLGVIVGWSISIAIGSLVISFVFNNKNKLSLADIFLSENIRMFLVSFIVVTLSLLISRYNLINLNFISYNLLIVGLFLVTISYFIWNNPVRIGILNVLKRVVIRNKKS